MSMSFKPFRPPSLKRPEKQDPVSSSYEAAGQSKRRKLSPDNEDDDYTALSQRPNALLTSTSKDRRPLRSVQNPPSPVRNVNDNVSSRSYFSIVWRKVTGKKNKTWEDDGIVACQNGLILAYNSKGHKIGSTVRDAMPEMGDTFTLSGKDIQIEVEVSKQEFWRIVGKDNGVSKDENVVIHHGEPQNKNLLSKQVSQGKQAPKMSLQEQMRQQIQNKKTAASQTPTIPAGRNAAFRNPLKESQVLPQVPSENPIPRHDPTARNALVFKRPKKVPQGKQIVDVVLDPILTKHLRDHQRAGVQFLYECVMDLRSFGGQGCILADDMGLGKTLQTIALIWTLVKQNPIYKADPVIKKVLIVCPVTLVQNWKKEFRKWLGRDKLGVMSFGDDGSRLSMFDGKNFKVMVVGYERLTKIAEDLTRGAGVDLVVCDEGHRLKSLQNKAAKAIETLNTPRRIILSGTPIQNDLSEFFAMVNFVNDGVLGTPKAFTKDFEKPIMKSRQPNATEGDIERGQEASNELAQTTSNFILRRTADILSKYLPAKTEYVLFCRPTPEQANVYRHVLQTPMFKSAVGSNEGALQMITILKKLCNSPLLLKPQQGADESTTSSSLQTLNEMMPKGLSRFYNSVYASKIRLLDQLLLQIRTTTDDKVVLVSNYTATLDLMQNLLTVLGHNYRRLDGSVPATKRQGMVDEFNRATPAACFAFLLSAKAGGVGINLIGGNRLILFDVDWNPATDDQAMARIHREGQKKPCYIYRFLIKGGLEERIWQRQVVKRGLASSIMESGAEAGAKTGKGKAAFSMDELKDLFRLDESDGLRTHDLIGCGCQAGTHVSVDASSDDVVHDVDELASSSSDEDEHIRTFSITRASQITSEDLEEQERSISTGSSPRKSPSKKRRKQQETELQELMTYTHIDTANASELAAMEQEELKEVIDDSCLMHVLMQTREQVPGNIAYVFLKKGKGSGLDEDKVVELGAEDAADGSTAQPKSISQFMAA